MPKKSNINVSFIHVLRVIVFVALAWVIFAAYTRTRDFLTTSPTFTVKNVQVESSIQFIDTAPLKLLVGRNIFSVDILKLQKQIQGRYPQIADLRVMRVLPDTIKILAKKRDVIFQTAVKGGYLVIDRDGTGLYITPKPAAVPIADGVTIDLRKVVPGTPLKSATVETLVGLINGFNARPELKPIVLTRIRAEHTSQITLMTRQGFDIMVDGDNVADQMQSLVMVLKNTRTGWANIKYIDVRFKEPIIADRSEEK